jgi:ABC-type sugar transport system substrate-binding protein
MGAIQARQRLEGLKESLAGDFGVIELNGDWSGERARMVVERWAGDLKPDNDLPGVFVAHNDEMALGTRQALRDASSTKNIALAADRITGCDGSQTFGQRLVREGRLKATVIMPPSSGVAIGCLARLRTRDERPPVRVVQPVQSYPPISKLKK